MLKLSITTHRARRSNRELLGALTRFALYTTALVGFLLLLPWAARDGSMETFMEEDGLVEQLQWLAIAAAAILCLVGAIRYQPCRPLLVSIGTIAAVAAVREQNNVLYELVPIFGWQGPMYSILFLGLVLLWRWRTDFLRQVAQFVPTAGFGLLWAGFAAVGVFAQMVGDHRIWQLFLPEQFERPTRRAIQELCETFGYFLLLTGAVEAVIHARQVTRRLALPASLAPERTGRLAGGEWRGQSEPGVAA